MKNNDQALAVLPIPVPRVGGPAAMLGFDFPAARSSSRRSMLKSVHRTDLPGCARRASPILIGFF
jgi:hypothetical protein